MENCTDGTDSLQLLRAVTLGVLIASQLDPIDLCHRKQSETQENIYTNTTYNAQHIQKDKYLLQKHGKSILMLKNLSKFVVRIEVALLNQQVLTYFMLGTENRKKLY